MIEIVERAKRGDQSAYAELYAFSFRYVTRVVNKILWARRPNDIEDVVQMAISSAFLKLSTFEGGAQYKTWLHSIAVNRALMTLRRNSTLDRASPLELQDADGETFEIEIPSTDHEFARREAAIDLERILGRVSVQNRNCVVRRHLDGDSLKDMARDLGISIAAAKTRLHRGLEQARELMNSESEPQVRCVDCAKADKFRFADTKIGDDPLCKWCATERRVESAASVCKEKLCGTCGKVYAPTGNAQKHCEDCRRTTPKGKSVPKTAPATRSSLARVSEERPGPTVDMVTVTIPVKVLDTMWESLHVDQKVRAFEFIMRE